MENGQSARLPVIFLGHGSRRGSETDNGLAVALDLAQRKIKQKADLHLAGFEFTQPPFQDVVRTLYSQGHRCITFLPFFLLEGRHLQEELPQELAALQEELPGLSFKRAEALGADPRLAQLAAERARQAIATLSGVKGPVGVVLVSRGSRRAYDPHFRLSVIVEWLSRELGPDFIVAGAQAEYDPPTIDEAVSQLAGRGARGLCVVPYLLFDGKVLQDNIVPVAGQAAARHGLPLSIAAPLGADPRLVDVALERLAGAKPLL